MTPMTTAADLYDWLVFLHIIAAMVWFGGLVALTVLAATFFEAKMRMRSSALCAACE